MADLPILKTLVRGEMHGYGIAQHLKAASNDVLQVGESSLYPALERLLLNGSVKAEWGASENNRREVLIRIHATTCHIGDVPAHEGFFNPHLRSSQASALVAFSSRNLRSLQSGSQVFDFLCD